MVWYDNIKIKVFVHESQIYEHINLVLYYMTCEILREQDTLKNII